MIKTMKKATCAILSVLLLLTGMTLPAAATEESKEGGVTVEASDFTINQKNVLTVSEREGGGFIFANKNAFTVKTTTKASAVVQVDVNLDENPVLTLVMGNCLCQYDAFYSLKGTNESHYLNDVDTADWRWSGSYALNLNELHGWSGEQKIVITIEYILWEIGPADAGAVSVEVRKLGFEPVKLFSLGELYGDDMVFQQNKPICVTGTGERGTEMSATLEGENGYTETVQTVIDANGEFSFQLSPLAGGYDTYTLTISDGNAVTVLKNIVIGEVWLAGGQSNMDYRLKWTVEGTEMTADDADDPYLRCNRIGEGSGWLMGDDLAAIQQCNAVGYYFAKSMREKLDVPVAIVHTARGSTSIYNWIGKDAYTDTKLKSYAKQATADLGNRYDELIAPLAGFRLCGLLWYQGEGNVGNTAGYYTRALNLLRDSWGELFGFEAGTMPLVVSHLAAHSYPVSDVNALPAFAVELSGAIEGMSGSVAQVTIYDLMPEYETPASGAPVDPIHPSHKETVGTRMAEAAYNLLYKSGSNPGAPVFKSFEVKDGAIYVTFDNVGSGLAVSSGDTLHGFCICGKNKVYLPADAKIVSTDTVRLSSDYVKEPFGASYAYSEFNMSANLVSRLYGTDYLPAVPFKTTVGQYYRVREWTACDSAEIWRGSTAKAGYEAAWLTDSGEISYSVTEKWGGVASLRLAYTADAEGLVTLSPNVNGSFNGKDTGKDYTNYGALLLHVKSMGDGVTLKAVRINSEEVAVNAAVGSDWTTLNVDISNIRSKSSVSSVTFVFADEAGKEGILYLDEISFGTDADAYEPYAELSPTAEPTEPDATKTPDDTTDGTPKTVRILLIILGCAILSSVCILVGTLLYSKKKQKK